MSSFGQWYEEQKTQENAPAASSSWFGGTGENGEQVLPLFGDTIQYSLGNFRSSMEAQMPQKILGMNYQQRFRVFCALLFLSAVFFGLAFGVGLPLIAFRPQKFALSFTFGSLIFMSSFAVLKGPMAHFKGMLEMERLPFTAIYITSMVATLYCTFSYGGATGYILVLGASGCQLVALLWYLISFLPGGSAGLHVVMSAICRVLQPAIRACGKLQAACMARCFSWMTSSSQQ